MFRRPHHRRIERLLTLFDTAVLEKCCFYFGGGTALALQLNEYRESVDIDFLCSNPAGYRELRGGVFNKAHTYFLPPDIKLARDLQSGRDSIRFWVDLEDGQRPINVEMIRDGEQDDLEPGDRICGVVAISHADAISTKLIANANRGLDRQHGFRDFIDLVMACHAWPTTVPAGFIKAETAYGDQIVKGVERVHHLLHNDGMLLRNAFEQLSVEEPCRQIIGDIVAKPADHLLADLGAPRR